MKQKKNIYLVVDQGFSTRYLLRSDLFKVLSKSNHQIVILAPNINEPYFRNEFTAENVLLYRYKTEKYSNYLKRSVIHRIIQPAFLFVYKNHKEINHPAFWYPLYLSTLKQGGFIKRIWAVIFNIFVKLLRKFNRFRELVQHISTFFYPMYHKDVFSDHPPDILITTSIGNLSYDNFIMNEARRNGAKLVSMVLSWDNPTTKGFSRIKPDYVVAWTDTMKRELVRFHGFDPENIIVGGIVQYDLYFSSNRFLSKAKLFNYFGMSEDRKLIFFCLMSPTQFPWNTKLISLLGELILQNVFSEPCQALVRLHPIYFRVENGRPVFQKELEEIQAIQKKYPYIYYDFPEILSQKMSYDMPFFETIKLGSTLKHSNILLCFFSSMMIEASIFDVPVINVAMVEKNEIPIKVIMNHNHIKRILETKGVKNAFTKQELINEINHYLSNPEIDKEGRKMIVARETGSQKGCAGIYIGNRILSIIEKS